MVKQIVALGERDRYLPGLRSWVGFRQTGVEVERNARYDEQPRVSLRGLWRLAKTAIFSFSTLPLSIFYSIGYAALGLFLALAVACAVLPAVHRPGDSRLDLAHPECQLLRRAQCAGHQHAGRVRVRIYDQVRGRPLYVIDRVVEHKAEPIAPPVLAGVEDWDQAYQNLRRSIRALLDMVHCDERRSIRRRELPPSCSSCPTRAWATTDSCRFGAARSYAQPLSWSPAVVSCRCRHIPIKQFVGRRSRTALHTAPLQNMTTLKRELGVFGATMMGLGSILGTGVFVSIGLAAGIAGPAVILATDASPRCSPHCNALNSAQLAGRASGQRRDV